MAVGKETETALNTLQLQVSATKALTRRLGCRLWLRNFLQIIT